MKILITGSNGFVGKNLIATLRESKKYELLLFERRDSLKTLEKYIMDCDFIVHLAGVNRPENTKEFYKNNTNLTSVITELLVKHGNKSPVLISSSTQVEKNNDYGKSKLLAENILKDLNSNYGNTIYLYRLPNLFGKWSKPFYNSVIATWSYQIARGEEIIINDANTHIELVYIDDFISDIIKCLENNQPKNFDHYYQVKPSYEVRLAEVADLLKSFKSSRANLEIPDMSDDFTKKLYSTYLNYIPKNDFKYSLEMNVDDRGSFTEFIKSSNSGQVSINISKPGITKGNHWHHSKNEKFLVVKGQAIIQFRDIFDTEILQYHVSEDKLEVLDIPTGYTHNIINVGKDDLVTVMWVNESYDSRFPDTYNDLVDENTKEKK